MTKNAVAKTTEAGLPAALAGRMARDAGRGTSNHQEDNLVPLIYILQSQSPQVNKRNADYIEGAEASDIWLRNASDPIVKGDEGFLFQPCYFTKDFVEWIPRTSGGGYAGRHPEKPEEAVEKPDTENPNRTRWVLPNGNHVVETRYHIGFVIRDGAPALPYVIPMSSSGHTVSRQWMFLMNQKQVEGKTAPSWACLYRLKTKERTNAAGTWFSWDIQEAGWIQSEDDYERGFQLNAAFETGEKVMDAPEENIAAGDSEAM